MLYVALAYEYYLSNEIEKSLEVLRNGGEKFETLSKNENTRTLCSAFIHVLRSTETFLLKQKGDDDLASKVKSQFFITRLRIEFSRIYHFYFIFYSTENFSPIRDVAKLLGVFFDQKLTWVPEIKVSKANRTHALNILEFGSYYLRPME